MSESSGDNRPGGPGPVINGPWGQWAPGGPGPTQKPKGPKLPDRHRNTRRRVIWSVVLVVIGLIVTFAGPVASLITDYMWFQDLGHPVVFWVTLLSGWVVGLVFAAVFFVLMFANVRLARRWAPKVRPVAPATTDPPWMQVVAQLGEITAGPWVDWVLLVVILIMSWVAGVAMSENWPMFQQFLNSTPFAAADPQFHVNIGFFVFQLPALRVVVDWLAGSLVVVTIVTAGVHLLDGAIRPWNKGSIFAPHVKAHLSVLAGLWFLVVAASTMLSTYELDLSPRGQVVGATYTDVHASLPALYILSAVAVLVAVLLIANIRFRGWRLPIIAVGVYVVALVLVGGAYPVAVQTFWVAPNEVSLERPYIKRNIDGTREAFGLTDVVARPFAAAENLTAAQLVANKDTLDNVRLWGPAVVKQTYQQLQGLRPYYEFKDVDIDRYTFGAGGNAGSIPVKTALPSAGSTASIVATVTTTSDNRAEVLISPRELNTADLAARAQTWVNLHLVYTHGYGVVMSPVNQANQQGLPNFIIKDVPPRSALVSVTAPGIYFGEDERDYTVVDTALKEFDFPQGEVNAQNQFAGRTGVPINGFFGRLLFALRYGATDFLFSGYLKPTSRVLFDRGIADRIRKLAPWISLDPDPYLTVIGGRLVWIQDGYTTSNAYPYSEPVGEGSNTYNYIRNSVKCTVDAYDGTTKLYAFDPKDPVLATWAKVYPGLLSPLSEMPTEVRQHLRYPEALFSIQANVFTTYHMTDPRVFYNKEDQWALPGSGKNTPMAPYYVLMRLPGEKTEQFILMIPFTPVGKDNMIGWMAAKCDPAEYGQRVVYQFPKQSLTLGPDQVSARVNQDPVISPQISLWDQRGSSVIFGNMLVIPVADSIVYVQPVYLQATTTAIPELTRVIVSYADKVAMEPDLASALIKVFGQGAGAAVPASVGGGTGTAGGGTAGGSSTATGTAGGATGTGGTGSTGALAGGDTALAASLYQQAVTAQRKGDWAAYGKAIDQLGVVLGRMAATSKGATATP